MIVRLKINKLLFWLLLPFSHKKVEYNVETARTVLMKTSPKPSGRAITINRILDHPTHDLQIIVPAYNVEYFLEECINSILTQKTKYTFKVVLIDDGSTDRTGEIADKYANDSRVAVIHQENRGFSGARNAGLSTLFGRYLMFVDSDDVLMPNAVEDLMDAAIMNNADIVEGEFCYLIYKFLISCYRHKENKPVLKGLYGYPWGKVYKSSLFKNICFPEGFWFEDTIVPFLLFSNAKKMFAIRSVVYAYRKNATGTISSMAPEKPKSIDSYWIMELMLEEYDRLSMSYNEACLNRILRQIIVNYNRVRLMDRWVQESIFILTRELLNSYFDTMSIEKSTFAKMIMDSDFGGYSLYCRMH